MHFLIRLTKLHEHEHLTVRYYEHGVSFKYSCKHYLWLSVIELLMPIKACIYEDDNIKRAFCFQSRAHGHFLLIHLFSYNS